MKLFHSDSSNVNRVLITYEIDSLSEIIFNLICNFKYPNNLPLEVVFLLFDCTQLLTYYEFFSCLDTHM